MPSEILIKGARLHNLKGVSLSIPRGKFVVFSGVSGSGKSTLGFDILLKEGQRQYLQSLGLLAYGYHAPLVESISGLSPAVSIGQNLVNNNPRSTVGTATGAYAYLRLAFARAGRRPCPACGRIILPGETNLRAEDTLAGFAEDESDAGAEFTACPHCRAEIPVLNMASFSFNKPAGACPICSGLGTIQEVDVHRLVDAGRSISAGAVLGWNAVQVPYYLSILRAAASHYHLTFDPQVPIKDQPQEFKDLLFFGSSSPLFMRHRPGIEPPETARKGRFEGIAASVLRRRQEHIARHASQADYHDRLEEYLHTAVCPACKGSRLCPESLQVTFGEMDITAMAAMPLEDLQRRLGELPSHLPENEFFLAEPALKEVHQLLDHLLETGVGYLSLDRPSDSISAGEAERLRLAALLGSPLSGVLYILDEPTIGLHQRDTQRLIGILKRLVNLGNTVIVIEHDMEVISSADYIVDFGPLAGKYGGEIVAVGSPVEIADTPRSITGRFLSGKESIHPPSRRRKPYRPTISIHGAYLHNLKNIDVSFPLGLFTAVSGVSGSGKTSLVFGILGQAARHHLYGAGAKPEACSSIEGLENIREIHTIDRQPIGRLSRSNTATYTGVFDPIRAAFASTPEAAAAGYTASHFSFNTPGGRCERCQGMGVLKVTMQLLPDAEITCPACRGARYTSHTLQVHYNGLNIAQVLELTVDEALPVFAGIPAAHNRLKALRDVGLGYLQLGQPADTLSGGESQRVHLAKALGRRSSSRSLYLMDEPTTGLHLADTARLIAIIQALVSAGSTVVVVEHNLDLINCADWVIDLGPEGGASGGAIVAQGSPEEVAAVSASHTGRFLAQASNKPTSLDHE